MSFLRGTVVGSLERDRDLTPDEEREAEIEAREDLERRVRIIQARVHAQRGGR